MIKVRLVLCFMFDKCNTISEEDCPHISFEIQLKTIPPEVSHFQFMDKIFIVKNATYNINQDEIVYYATGIVFCKSHEVKDLIEKYKVKLQNEESVINIEVGGI